MLTISLTSLTAYSQTKNEFGPEDVQVLQNGDYLIKKNAFMVLWAEYQTQKKIIEVYKEYVENSKRIDKDIDKLILSAVDMWKIEVQRNQQLQVELAKEKQKGISTLEVVGLTSITLAVGVLGGFLLAALL